MLVHIYEAAICQTFKANSKQCWRL